MPTRQMTANASHLMVEQLVASGVKYVFNNSGSREALFFNELHSRSDIHGILGLHEGTVTAMAGGYTQANLVPGVMVVHLGAGLAQCMGQLINVWTGSLPVVVITFAGDTGSFADRISLDLSHNAGPTAISAPMTKASWTVIEPEGLPAAIERALRVAMTPPVGPVHLAIYDRLLGPEQYTANIIEGDLPEIRTGYPSDSDVEKIAQALRDAKRPLLYTGDGIWKSGADAEVTALAERFGIPVVGELRGVSIKHPLHCGGRRLEQAGDIDPDLILCFGVRHNGAGTADDYSAFFNAERIIAVGSDVENLQNIPGLDLAVLADEKRTAERLLEITDSPSDDLADRRAWAREEAASLRARRRGAGPGCRPLPPRSPQGRRRTLHPRLDVQPGLHGLGHPGPAGPPRPRKAGRVGQGHHPVPAAPEGAGGPGGGRGRPHERLPGPGDVRVHAVEDDTTVNVFVEAQVEHVPQESPALRDP